MAAAIPYRVDVNLHLVGSAANSKQRKRAKALKVKSARKLAMHHENIRNIRKTDHLRYINGQYIAADAASAQDFRAAKRPNTVE